MTRCCSGLAPSRRELMTSAGGIAALVTAWRAGAAPAPTERKPPALSAFPLRDVRLLDGPFRHAQQRTADYLLSLDADRLLHGFRRNAGLVPRAPIYGGWESQPIWADIHCQGHTLGHYLSACALMFGATGDTRFRQRADYVVAELATCQQASGSGLVSAFSEGPQLVTAFIAGEKVSGVPWYTLHKVYAGLRDAYAETGSAQALAVWIRFADWATSATRDLSDERFEAMLDTEHGGMSEVFADLYAITGRDEDRRMADRFLHKAVLVPLSKRQDHLDGLHANTQLPKIVGFQRVYEVTGEPRTHEAAAFFWRTVVHTRSYPTGGHGDGEHFFPIADTDTHALSAKGSETCGIYNMLKLTRLLFQQDPQPDYADFYERALLNGILASQDPASGMVTYFQGARPGYMKLYSTPVDSFWCCTGTGMENHAKYGEAIYSHAGDRALYVNLFIPSVLNWRERGAVLTQTTSFPEGAGSTFRWQLKRPTALALRLRHPGWSPTAELRVNGAVVQRSDRPGRFLEIDRQWRDGDVVELALAMQVRPVSLPGGSQLFALTYGPMVLTAALGSEGIAPGADIVVNERKYGEYLSTPVTPPQLTGTPDAVAAAVRPTGAPLVFATIDGDAKPLTLVPYHRIAHERYATYWRTPGVLPA